MTNCALQPPVVLVFFGLIASGKSYLARAWSAKYGYACYNSDVVRKELAGIQPTQRQEADVDAGIYSPAFSRRTYDTLVEHAASELAKGAACVVLDGSYQAQSERQKLLARLGDLSKVIFVLCRCEEVVVKQRLEQRAADPTAVSDGRWEIYLKQRKTFSPPEELAEEQLLTIETNSPVDALISILDEALERREIFLK